MTEKTAAIVTIKRASDMTPGGRKTIADWLRACADNLEKDGADYSEQFRARYIYQDHTNG